MGKLAIVLTLTVTCLFIAIPTCCHAKQAEDEESLFQNICSGREKVAKIHFYVQDILGGPNATVYEVARASITSVSPTWFGRVLAVDDLVTAGPGRDSENLGRSQGVVTFSDLHTSAATMNFNIVFASGKYNGSTISFVGRNQIASREREFSVVGGTGVFRLSRGYVIVSTYSIDISAERTYAVLEHMICATHTDI